MNNLPLSLLVNATQRLIDDPSLNDDERDQVSQVQEDIQRMQDMYDGDAKEGFIQRLMRILARLGEPGQDKVTEYILKATEARVSQQAAFNPPMQAPSHADSKEVFTVSAYDSDGCSLQVRFVADALFSHSGESTGRSSSR